MLAGDGLGLGSFGVVPVSNSLVFGVLLELLIRESGKLCASGGRTGIAPSGVTRDSIHAGTLRGSHIASVCR